MAHVAPALTALDEPLTVPLNEAAALAASNLTRNIAAVGSNLDAPDCRWMFGRDGALTGQDSNGDWWEGCSVPRAAAKLAVARLNVTGITACLLAPSHAGQIARALELLELNQALIVIEPRANFAAFAWSCEDFSAAVRSHRLFWAIGENWPGALAEIFHRHPGLPTPTQFVRWPGTSDATAAPLMKTAQEIFESVGRTRSAALKTIKSISRGLSSRRSTLLVRPGRFRLWENAADCLAETLPGAVDFDPDIPSHAGPLALMSAAKQCDVLLAANLARGDAAGLEDCPVAWITWMTCGRIPRPCSDHPQDQLLLADPAWEQSALSSGWSPQRVGVAPWPRTISPPPRPTHLAMIADLPDLTAPVGLEEMSSHRLLWDAIREHLLKDPEQLGRDLGGYFRDRCSAFGLDPAALHAGQFIEGLIVPAWQQGIVRRLRAGGVPIKCHGRGWDAVELNPCQRGGEVRCRDDFRRAVSEASALICPWPIDHAHAIDGCGRSVLRCHAVTGDLLAAARAALNSPPIPVTGPTLSQALAQAIERARA